MASTKHYDCIVVGSGQAGTPLATALAKNNKKTALVEKDHVGGCCINEGCTPTKTMVASGRVAYLSRRGPDFGVNATSQDGQIQIDMKKIRQRKRDIVTSFRSGSESRLKTAGVDLLSGEAAFTDVKTMQVKMQDGSIETITAPSIFLNTGERPAKIGLKGMEDVSDRILDSTSIQELDAVPQHLLVLGGGPIGVEFGQLFGRLGAQVTIIQHGAQLVPREDADIAEKLHQILKQDGITVHLNASALEVRRGPKSGTIELTVNVKDGPPQTISASHILSAAGRVPNTDMLNLPSAGIRTTAKGYIEVNPALETTIPGIYAIGDVKGPPAFTHISYDDFRIVQANLITKSSTPRTMTNRQVPYVTYTDPQLAHIGIHQKDATPQNYPDETFQVAKMPMEYVARALECDETRGMMKAIVSKRTGHIMGFTCLGLEGGEIMSVVQMAMLGNVPWQALQNMVFAHPSLAESLNNLWGFLEDI